MPVFPTSRNLMKLGKIKTARLLITRLAVQVRLGEPKESKPLQLIAAGAFSVGIAPLKRIYAGPHQRPGQAPSTGSSSADPPKSRFNSSDQSAAKPRWTVSWLCLLWQKARGSTLSGLNAVISPSAFCRQRPYADTDCSRTQTARPGRGEDHSRPLPLKYTYSYFRKARGIRSSRCPSSDLGHPLKYVPRPLWEFV